MQTIKLVLKNLSKANNYNKFILSHKDKLVMFNEIALLLILKITCTLKRNLRERHKGIYINDIHFNRYFSKTLGKI